MIHIDQSTTMEDLKVKIRQKFSNIPSFDSNNFLIQQEIESHGLVDVDDIDEILDTTEELKLVCMEVNEERGQLAGQQEQKEKENEEKHDFVLELAMVDKDQSDAATLGAGNETS